MFSETNQKLKHHYEIIIVGNTAAGTGAIESIRALNPEVSVLVISEETELGYFRPMVSAYLYDAHKPSMFYLHSEAWYIERNIHLLLGASVESIDTFQKSIKTNSDHTFEFDRLILANGSRNNVPPIKNIHIQGVFTVRTKKDADDIKAYSKTTKEAIVIGGGLLGLEFAWGLKNLGLDVTVLEIADRLLPRQLDHEGSRLFESGVLSAGIKVRKNVKIQSLIGDAHVEAIRIGEGEGEILACQMVLVSAGVKPNKALAESAGIACNRGVLVDASMKTSVDDIYAAGDVAEINGMCFGLWPMSLEQGKVAGAAALGETGTWKMTVPSSIFKSMNLQVFSIGDIMSFEDRGLRSVTDYDKLSGIYIKLYFENDIYVGGILMGNLKKSGVLQKSIGKDVPMAEMIESIFMK